MEKTPKEEDDIDFTLGMSDTVAVPTKTKSVELRRSKRAQKRDSTSEGKYDSTFLLDNDTLKRVEPQDTALQNTLLFPQIEPFTPARRPPRNPRAWTEQLKNSTLKNLMSNRHREEQSRSHFEEVFNYMKAKDQHHEEATRKRDVDLQNSFQQIHERIDSIKEKTSVDHTENDRRLQMAEDAAFAKSMAQKEQKDLYNQHNSSYYNNNPYNIPHFSHDINGNAAYTHQPDTAKVLDKDVEPIGNLSYLFKDKYPFAQTVDNDRSYGDHAQAHYGEHDNSKPLHQGLCRLQPPHTLLVSFQKTGRAKTVTTNAHTFIDWYQYMKALYTSCYLECLNHMSPHLVPKDKASWQQIEATHECRQHCVAAVMEIKDGIIPRAHRSMTIPALTGIFNAVMLSWPSMILTINSILGNSIDSVTLSHVKDFDNVDSYTIRITYFKVVNTFIMSNDNAKTIRLKAFLNKSEYKTSESPSAFASRLLLEQRDINILYSGKEDTREAVITSAMLKETFLDSIRRRTDKMYDNILDNIENENISFKDLVERINNKYMKEKSRIVTESLFSVNTVKDSNVNSQEDDHDQAYYSTSSQVPVKRREDKSISALPCFQMRDKGKCEYGTTCRFSHDPQLFKKPVSKTYLIAELGQQNKYLHENLFLAQQQHQKYKKKYNFSKTKKPFVKKAGPSKPGPVKFFEDVGKSNSNTHKVNLAVDGATTDEQVNEESDNEYTTDVGGVESDTSDSE